MRHVIVAPALLLIVLLPVMWAQQEREFPKVYVELEAPHLARFDDWPGSRDGVIIDMLNKYDIPKDAFVYEPQFARYIVRLSPEGTRCRWTIWRGEEGHRERKLTASDTAIKSGNCVKDAANWIKKNKDWTE